MVVFDFFLKNSFYFSFLTIEWHKATRTRKKLCATSINIS